MATPQSQTLKDFQIKERNLRRSDAIVHSPPKKDKNTKILAFYAEKGGVGKTTNVISLGFTLAEQGHRVLMFDCDSQRNLSGFIFGLELIGLDSDDLVESPLSTFINKTNLTTQDGQQFHRTLYEQVADNSRTLKPAFAHAIKNNLWLVPGDRNTSDLDATITREEHASLPGYGLHHVNEKTGKPYQAIMATADYYNADYVLLDLNPSKGALTKCLIMTSHYLIVPVIADLYSNDTLIYMEDSIMKWFEDIKKWKMIFEDPVLRPNFNLPDHWPKFMGYILNRIDSNMIGDIENGIEVNRLRKSENHWVHKIELAAKKLTNALQVFPYDKNTEQQKSYSLALSTDVYRRVKRTEKIGVVREFWGLKNISDTVHLPVCFLEDRHMVTFNNEETVTPYSVQDMLKKIDVIEKWKCIYKEIACTILHLIETDSNIDIGRSNTDGNSSDREPTSETSELTAKIQASESPDEIETEPNNKKRKF